MKEENVSLNLESKDFVMNQSKEYFNSSKEELFLNEPAITIGVQDFKCGKITLPPT